MGQKITLRYQVPFFLLSVIALCVNPGLGVLDEWQHQLPF